MVLGFGRNKVKVRRTEEGSHGNHWQAIFGFDEGKDMHACVQSMWEDVSIEKEIDKSHATIRAKYGIFSLLGIQVDDQISTLFPSLQTEESVPIEILQIAEWAHVDATEAQVAGQILETPLQVAFFATDYLENKKKYRKGGTLQISLSGVAYGVGAQEDLSDRYAADFCSFIRQEESPLNDDYDFVSNVLSLSDGKLKGHLLKLIKLRLYNGASPSETIDLPVITSVENVRISDLSVGDKVSGSLWMQGRIKQ